MSHLTTYKSDVLVNCKKSLLKKAVADLGLELDYSIKEVSNMWIRAKVEAGFVKEGKPIAVGITFEEEGAKKRLKVEGDFYGTRINEQGFINKLAQAYKKHDVIHQCSKQGWIVDENDITIDNKTNEIVIEAHRYSA